MHRVAVAMWACGLVIYAANSLIGGAPTGAPTIEQGAPTPTTNARSPAASRGQTPAGATLAEIMRERPDQRAIGMRGAVHEGPGQRVRVARPVAAHSGPLVSAPTTYRFAKGKELQVLSRQGVWIEVRDPVTKFKGWVLNVYTAPDGTSISEDVEGTSKVATGATAKLTAAYEDSEMADTRPQRKGMKNKRAKLKERRRSSALADADLGRPRSTSGGYGRSTQRRDYNRGQQRRVLLRPFGLRHF